MRILILKDDNVTEGFIDSALERIKADYAAVTPVSWTYKLADFSTTPWEYYDAQSKGLDREFIKSVAQDMWNRENERYDHLIFVIHPTNWQDGTSPTGGWNLGRYYPYLTKGYSVEIVKATGNDDWLYKIFGFII